MRAFAIDQFGTPGTVRDLPTPEPADGEILVRVRAAGLNAMDAGVLAGYLKDYMEHRFPLVPGSDASGVVERVGPGVDGLTVGDDVIVDARKPFLGAGTVAEFVVVPSAAAVRKPDTIDHPQAAALPLAGSAALSAVEAFDPRAGETVVVIGATGGVGSYATQLLTGRGARVIAVTRTEHAEYARSLGAADVIDYTTGNAVGQIRSRHGADLAGILDFVGDKDFVNELADLVRSGGRVVSTAGGADAGGLADLGLSGMAANAASPDRLGEWIRLVDEQAIRTPTITTFSLSQASDAIEQQAARHVGGKLVILVD